METTDYNKQANDFLSKTGATMKINFSHNGKHFADDKQNRDIYKITISKGKRHYTFDFGQSIAKTGTKEAPTPYDVLACLQKYDVGSFEDFCWEFGYNVDSSQAEKTYKAVCKEYEKLCTIFSDDEMELMQEIQ